MEAPHNARSQSDGSLGRLLAAILLCVGCSPSPKTYEDCILQNVKPGMSDTAAQLVHAACREKFPLAPPVEASVDSKSLETLAANFSENRAIRMVRESSVLLRSVSRSGYLEREFNDAWFVQKWIEALKGEVEVLGWRSERKSPGVLIVSFTVRHRAEVVGFYWEVQLPSKLIRLVTNDTELEAKYAVPANSAAKQWLLHFVGKAPDPYIEPSSR